MKKEVIVELYQSVPDLLGHRTVLILRTVLEVGQQEDLEEEHSKKKNISIVCFFTF